MKDESLCSILEKYYVIFVVEGTNEEEILKWLIEAKRIGVDTDSDNCDMSHLRSRTKQGKAELNRFLEYNFNKPAAIVYIHDGKCEKFSLDKKNNHIPVFHLITRPEIEILFVNYLRLDDEYRAESRRLKESLKPSVFLKSRQIVENCKDYRAVRQIFKNDVENLIKTLATYKSKRNNDLRSSENQYYIYDLVKD